MLTGRGFSEISRASRRPLDVKIAGNAAKTGSLSHWERAGVRGRSKPCRRSDPITHPGDYAPSRMTETPPREAVVFQKVFGGADPPARALSQRERELRFDKSPSL